MSSDLSKSASSGPVLQYLNASSGDKHLIIFKETPDTIVALKVCLVFSVIGGFILCIGRRTELKITKECS